MIIFTLVFGRHVRWWPYALDSLEWGRNGDILKFFDVFTDEDSRDEVEKVMRERGMKGEVSVIGTKQALSRSLGRAAERGDVFCYAPPDLIFGADSVWNMAMCCRSGQFVAAAHFRVLPTIYPSLADDRALANDELFSLAQRHMHSVIGDSMGGGNTFKTGTRLDKLTDDHWIGTFYLPSIHVCRPLKKDGLYFENQPANHWDHDYPSRLVDERRYRVVGSSDIAFAVEITLPDQHRKPMDPRRDGYRDSKRHNLVNECFVVSFRGSTWN